MDFPTSIEGWFDLAMKVGGLLLALWGTVVLAIRKPLVTKINGLGSRVNKLELDTAATVGAVSALERVDEIHNFQVAALSERQGKIEGQVEGFEQRLGETLQDISGRLGSIEGQVKIIAQNIGRHP